MPWPLGTTSAKAQYTEIHLTDTIGGELNQVEGAIHLECIEVKKQ